MFIQTEATCDPASMRFLPGCEVLPGGPLEIRDKREAAVSSLAARILDVDGVASLSLGQDYIAVTMKAGDWRHLRPVLLAAIAEHFASGRPILDDVAAEAGNPLAARVREALRQVIDPELGYNIVDLGLVYDIEADDGAVAITMTTTTIGCPATAYLSDGVRRCAAFVDGVTGVDVHLTHVPPWSHELMSDGAKAFFGFAAANDR